MNTVPSISEKEIRTVGICCLVQAKKFCYNNTGVALFIGSWVRCLFCFETCITEGRGGEKGESANFKTKYT